MRGKAVVFFGSVVCVLLVNPVSFAQELGQGQSLSVSYARIALAFLAAMGVVVVGFAFTRHQRLSVRNSPFGGWSRLFSNNAESEIRVIEVKRIGLGAEILLIESLNAKYLVLVTANSATVLKKEDT